MSATSSTRRDFSGHRSSLVRWPRAKFDQCNASCFVTLACGMKICGSALPAHYAARWHKWYRR